MKIDHIANHSASVSFTEAELVLLNNSLNEVLNEVEMSDFDTRLGTSRVNAQELLGRIN